MIYFDILYTFNLNNFLDIFSLLEIEFLFWFFVLFCFGLVWFWFWFWFLVFWDRVFLYSPGCPGTHSVDQAGLELRNPPASASQVLGLKVCTTTRFTKLFFFKDLFIICKCTVAAFRHPRRGHQISLPMVVSHHVMAGIWTHDLWNGN